MSIKSQGGHPASPEWPMLEVRWLYKKADLDHQKLNISTEDYHRFIGENEIFPCE
jgi:hypothetical protein